VVRGEEDVLRDGQRRYQVQFLVDHRDAGALRSAGLFNATG